MEHGGFPLGGALEVTSGFSLCDSGLQDALKAGRVLERGARKSGASYTSDKARALSPVLVPVSLPSVSSPPPPQLSSPSDLPTPQTG